MRAALIGSQPSRSSREISGVFTVIVGVLCDQCSNYSLARNQPSPRILTVLHEAPTYMSPCCGLLAQALVLLPPPVPPEHSLVRTREFSVLSLDCIRNDGSFLAFILRRAVPVTWYCTSHFVTCAPCGGPESRRDPRSPVHALSRG